jgi:hypothetical protein
MDDCHFRYITKLWKKKPWHLSILNIIVIVFGLHCKIIYVFDMNQLKNKLFVIHFDAHHSFLLHFLVLVCMCLYTNSWFLFVNKVWYAIETEQLPWFYEIINKFINHLHLVSNIVFFFTISFCIDWKKQGFHELLIENFYKSFSG